MALVLFNVGYPLFENDLQFIVICLLITLTVLGLSTYYFYHDQVENHQLLTVISLHACSLILMFAAIYRGFGLKVPDTDDEGCKSKTFEKCNVYMEQAGSGLNEIDAATSLYFSLVTWTTLGYGDYQPKADLQLVASAQALIGYLYLGLIVSFLSAVLNKNN